MSRRIRRDIHKRISSSGYEQITGDLEIRGRLLGPTISDLVSSISVLSAHTTTPVPLTVTRCEGAYKGIILQCAVQYNLQNFSHYEWQVSSNQVDWYSLKSDGTDWKGTLNADTDVEGPMFVHTPIPFDGTAEVPVAVTLYYRVRQRTFSDAVCAWSAASSATTLLVENGDILGNTITGNKMEVGSIKARELSFGSDAGLVPIYENTDPMDANAHLFDLSQPDCVANTGILPASGREIVYAPATSQDETLKEYPHPWSPRLYGQSEAIFAARTNLVADPEDLTTANWEDWGAVTESLSDYYTSKGQRYTKMTAGGAGGGKAQHITFTGDAIKSYQGWLRRGSETVNTWIGIFDGFGAGTWKGLISVNWTTKVVACAVGILQDYEWDGDDAVWISGITDSITVAHTNYVLILTDTNGAYFYATAFQVEDAIYPSPYIDKFRWPMQVRPVNKRVDYAVTMPSKFVFKIKVRPWFTYDTATYPMLATWYIDGTHQLIIYYALDEDTLKVYWVDGGTVRVLSTEQFDNGAAFDDLNSELILFGAVDLTTATGNNRFFAIVAGAKQGEGAAWGGAPDALTSSFTILSIGHRAGANLADSLIHSAKFWTWTGAALGTLNTEADIDRVTAALTPLFSWEGEDYDVGYKPTGKQGAVGLFKATTNLASDPENLTGAAWAETTVTPTLSDYYIDGKRFSKLLATAANGYSSQTIAFTGDGVKSVQYFLRRGTDTTTTLVLRDTTAPADRLRIVVTWATKAFTETTGSVFNYAWLSDDILWIACLTSSVTAANTNSLRIEIDTNATYSYVTAIQAENSVYPTPYTPTTRAAGVLQYPLALPRKFTAMFWLRPWFNYNTANTVTLLTWYVAANNVFLIYYVPATDQITVGWIDGGVARYLHGPTLNSAALLNQNIMVAATIDLDGGQTGSMLKVYAGATIGSDKDWLAAPDAKTTEFPTLCVGYDPLAPTGVADSFLTDLLILPGVLLTEVQCDEHFNKTRPWYSTSEVASNNKQVRIDRSGIRLHNAQLNITDWRNRQILISNRDGLLAKDAAGQIIHDLPETPIVTGMQYLGHLFLQPSATYIAWDGAAATSVATSAFDDSGTVQFNLSTYLPPQFGNPHGVKILVGVLVDVAANKITHATTNETVAGAAIWYSPNFAWGGHAAGGGIQGFYFQADVQAHAAAAGWDLVKYGIFDAPVVWNAGVPYYIYEAHSAIYNMVANNGAFEVRVLSSILGWWV